MENTLPASYLAQKAAEAAFDERRLELAAECTGYRSQGLTFSQIAEKLNSEGRLTKTGKPWSQGNVCLFLQNPNPPIPRESKSAKKQEKALPSKVERTKTSDLDLGWARHKFPELHELQKLARKWLALKTKALPKALQAINDLMTFIVEAKLPLEPKHLLHHSTEVASFAGWKFGPKKPSKYVIEVNNTARAFFEWVLSQPEYCEEDDNGRLVTSSAFRNPIEALNNDGTASRMHSVYRTLPFGYIEELRKMIAQGPNFKDWAWAQNAMGALSTGVGKEPDEDDDTKIAPIWYQVPFDKIDHNDPDCVWRTRERLVPGKLGRAGQGRKYETIYEMWSPVRWVALLIKLQLPLRTHQVRMLDSGEGDNWKRVKGEWQLNDNPLAKGTVARPRANGVLYRPNQTVDGDVDLCLYSNTNKTADIGKEGSDKGYVAPWVVGGPQHQDPYYWLEKLRDWQEKYNPLDALTSWTELEARHLPVKSPEVLADYLDTAFLFRMPEDDSPHLPVATSTLYRPWYILLRELENRMAARGEKLPGGGRIRFAPNSTERYNGTAVFFPLHSLRVSLITVLAVEGKVPLAILQKLVGHSRLIMTLYYVKPGFSDIRRTLQAGIKNANDAAGENLVDWLAHVEYTQAVKEAIANSPETFRAAVAEAIYLRVPAGWMQLLDGLCLAGGNATDADSSGCQDGGPNIGNASAPRYAPVEGGARNCPMCRWFITKPYFLPQLVTRWNNVSYHVFDSKEQVAIAERDFRYMEDRRAAAFSQNQPFEEQQQYTVAERVLEQVVQKFGELTKTLAAITRLIERCRETLELGNGTAIVAVGGLDEFNYVINEVDSELLQVSGVCEGTLLYPDLPAGKAVLRQGQLLDAALVRDNLPPVFLTLNEQEQKLVGHALMEQLAMEMNPDNPSLGRYEVISLIDARQSLTQRLGRAVEDAVRSSSLNRSPQRIIPLKPITTTMAL